MPGGGLPASAQPPRLARLLARAPPPGPPSPETGVARRPCFAGPTRAAEAPCASGRATARRIRSRRLPAASYPSAPPSQCVDKLAQLLLEHREAAGGGEGIPRGPVSSARRRSVKPESRGPFRVLERVASQRGPRRMPSPPPAALPARMLAGGSGLGVRGGELAIHAEGAVKLARGRPRHQASRVPRLSTQALAPHVSVALCQYPGFNCDLWRDLPGRFRGGYSPKLKAAPFHVGSLPLARRLPCEPPELGGTHPCEGHQWHGSKRSSFSWRVPTSPGTPHLGRRKVLAHRRGVRRARRGPWTAGLTEPAVHGKPNYHQADCPQCHLGPRRLRPRHAAQDGDDPNDREVAPEPGVHVTFPSAHSRPRY